jgi:chromosome partitioning protein
VQTLVIDTPAGAEADAAAAVVLATVSVIVVRPTYLDLAAAARTIDVVRRLDRPSLVVINQAPPARDAAVPPVVRRARAALEAMHAPTPIATLPTRQVYQTAFESGRSAEECDPIAAREIDLLWRSIQGFAASGGK